MRPKSKRVTKKSFNRLGQSFHGQLLTFRKVAGVAGRFSFVVSKKVSPKAVARNKLKRMGHEALLRIKKLPEVSGVFFFKKGAEKLSFKDLVGELTNLLRKL